MPLTQIATKIAWIARKYDLVSVWSINSLRHLLAMFINVPQKRAVAFSAKAKKKQLQSKREEQRETRGDGDFLEKRNILLDNVF